MNDLTESSALVLIVAGLAVGTVVFLIARRFLFWRYRRIGEKALAESNYSVAILSLSKAERLWHFNPYRHSTKSHNEDLGTLQGILDEMERAALSVGSTLDVANYRQAVIALRGQFSGEDGGLRSKGGSSYAAAFTNLRVARSLFRKQLVQDRTNSQ